MAFTITAGTEIQVGIVYCDGLVALDANAGTIAMKPLLAFANTEESFILANYNRLTADTLVAEFVTLSASSETYCSDFG